MHWICAYDPRAASSNSCLVTITHTKAVNSNFSPKIGCYGNDPLSLNLGYVFIG